MGMKKNLIGIVQGRLTPSKTLQHFPKDPFKEFSLANKIGYDFIELFTERKFNKKNPIWSNYGRKLLIKHSKKNNLLLYSLCDDHIILNGFNNKYLSYVKRLTKFLNELKINIFIIPLEGKAQITENNLKKITLYLKKISQICSKNKIKYFLIESNVGFEVFNKIKKNLKKEKLYFLYDLGNRVNQYPDLYKDILNFGRNIKQIHMKDKNNKNENVVIGKGNVNFDIAFKAIKKLQKNNLSFVFENNRGNNAFLSAKKNFNFLNSYLKK
jgi:sugar phosphate isomerase/epimerase